MAETAMEIFATEEGKVMPTPHIHRDLIVAWANGEEIEFFNDIGNKWQALAQAPAWNPTVQYRIKAKPPQYRIFQSRPGAALTTYTRNTGMKHEDFYAHSVERNHPEGKWLTDWLPMPEGFQP